MYSVVTSSVLLYMIVFFIVTLYFLHSTTSDNQRGTSQSLRHSSNTSSHIYRKFAKTEVTSDSMSLYSEKADTVTTKEAMFPRIIYGTAWKKERTKDLVELAVKTGFRAIDVACQPKHYNEPGVGDALLSLYEQGVVARGDLFLQTKFTAVTGQDPENIPYDKDAPLASQVQESFSVSLRNLHTDYLDSLVLHSPMRTLPDTLTVWKTFEDIYKKGGVRALGLSNTYDLRTLQAVYDAAEIKPTVLQNRFYAKSGYDVQIRQFCLEHGIHYESFWTLTGNPKILTSDVVQQLAAKYGKTKEQIFFRFVQSIGIIPLSGTKSVEHMRQDLEAVASTFELTHEEVLRVDDLLHNQ
jgi:diketogulonate reductase-like aldo/keto reductase